MKPRKAIITAAGYGTRLLPATKNIPKELLPVLNKPFIHEAVRQCIEAGLEEIIIVTRYGNHLVEDYFDNNPELNNYLESKNKDSQLHETYKLVDAANFIFIRSERNLPYGNASPLYSAKHLIDEGESFLYLWGDEFLLGQENVVESLITKQADTNADCVLTCMEIEHEEDYDKLGVIKINEVQQDQVDFLIEKPGKEMAPSNMGSISPYLLSSNIFKYLDPAKLGHGGEFLFQDAFHPMTADNYDIRYVVTKNLWLTNGNPEGYFKSIVEYALHSPDRDKYLQYLQDRLAKE